MAKPRIIIADLNEDNIMPLQQQFIKHYFEKIDLETVTDENYFEHYFSLSPSADVLIISEGLYDVGLNLDDIKTVIVMSSEPEGEGTDLLNVIRISIRDRNYREIFNRIVELSGNILDKEDTESQTTVILVNSATGGSGNTVVALGLCEGLAKKNKNVLYIDAETIQNYQYYLKDTEEDDRPDIYETVNDMGQDIYEKIKPAIRKKDFYYLPPLRKALNLYGLKQSVYTELLSSAKASDDYDYIVVDSNNAMDDFKKNLLNKADKRIVVMIPTAVSVYSTSKLAECYRDMGIKGSICICNQFEIGKNSAEKMRQQGIDFTVAQYIRKIDEIDQKPIEELAQISDFQKLTFLVM